MTKKCSECGGVLISYTYKGKTILECSRCGRKKEIVETEKIIDMSETANLKVIMD